MIKPHPTIQQQFPIHEYRNMAILETCMESCHPHLHRPLDSIQYSQCIFCRESGQKSQNSGEFELLQIEANAKISESGRPAICQDALVVCPHPDCQHQFHISCITKYKVYPRFDAQYTCLQQNVGNVTCPDHFCGICFNENFQKSSTMGTLIKDSKFIRSFHDTCMPLGSVLVEGKLMLIGLLKFEGKHFPICHLCGDYNSIDDLIESDTCCHVFHKSCQKTVTTQQPTIGKQCDDCLFNVPKRTNEKVIAFVNGKWRILSPDGTTETGMAKIYFSQGRKASFALINSLFCPFPTLAEHIYKTAQAMKLFCPTETKNIEEYFRARTKFNPSIPLPSPVLTNNTYVIHQSMQHVFPASFPANVRIHPDVEVGKTKETGYGLFAKNDIKRYTMIGEFVGEVISNAEAKKREKLGFRSHDREQQFYSFQTKLRILKSKRNTTVKIDGSRVGNEMRMLNHSCAPNCEVKSIPRSINGSSIYIIQIIAKKNIKKGNEICINYNWSRTFDCRCEQCKEIEMEKSTEKENETKNLRKGKKDERNMASEDRRRKREEKNNLMEKERMYKNI